LVVSLLEIAIGPPAVTWFESNAEFVAEMAPSW